MDQADLSRGKVKEDELECSPLGGPFGESLYSDKFQVKLKLDTPAKLSPSG
jgi:hypothetical protein